MNVFNQEFNTLMLRDVRRDIQKHFLCGGGDKMYLVYQKICKLEMTDRMIKNNRITELVNLRNQN